MMEQDIVEDEYSRNAVVAADPVRDVPPDLTYDEKKAAEAAFRGEPFNPAWSAAAAKVYDGILAAKGKRSLAMRIETETDTECSVGWTKY